MISSLTHAVPRASRASRAASRLSAALGTTHVDDLGGLCVGEIALTDIADEFGTPT
jgi:hypothetical protein